ncbi:molybdopterin-dependent oxidoreductase [bacterium]|jgi:isoquinoline 1-oxidoreductase subunit beta|nr:xanthine dehydrogenase family protein molybdopterin-binding subunit [Gammaproteobacteria bacterium]MCH1550473.1 molybdopterin-dependent oxidoreductase [Pseudomonadales bacterium]MDC0559309.1 molybdopterin-dependent oxidoreductase [bacterium]
MNEVKLSRRKLFKASALAGGGFLLQMALPISVLAAEKDTLVRSKALNVYVQIDADGQITIYSAHPEMGQGIMTSLPMIVAEEMGANWEDVKVLQAPVDTAQFGFQGAGGSTSIPRNYQAMREMGASAREMLIAAAALLMEVDTQDLEARNSEVVHASGNRRTFGQLAALAAQQEMPDPEMLSFKDPRAYTIIGTSVGGVDNLVIATGQSQFGIDVDLPGMKYATYSRCPRLGGKAVAFNEVEIKKLPGVTDAFILQPDARAGKASMSFIQGMASLRGGVAIIGNDTWSVIDAKNKLKVQWDETASSDDSWSGMVQQAQALARSDHGEVKRDDDQLEAAMSDPSHLALESFYEFPFVAHVCMEPMNCTAHFIKGRGGEPDSMELWMGSQFPAQAKEIASNMLGIAPENVKVNLKRLGGGFGRRAIHDFAAEAMAIAYRVDGPVKLTWTRTDDIHHDFFRVGGFENMRAAIDANGKLAAWDQHYIGFAHDQKPVIGSGFRGNELPMTVLERARVRQSMIALDTPCGAWRAPGANTNAFVEQSFIHELAVLAQRDHVEFLIELMGARRWTAEGNVNALNTGRAIDVIKMAAEKAAWGKPMPSGSAQGFAFYFCHAAHIAQVAEVSVDGSGNYHVDKVVVAVDVGPIINRSGALSQVEGSIIDGLSTMAGQQITMEKGVIEQDNFHQYPVTRIAQTPKIEVHFIESDHPSTGLGEPALPPLAPAVTNAIFAATGDRIRSMPLSAQGYQLV